MSRKSIDSIESTEPTEPIPSIISILSTTQHLTTHHSPLTTPPLTTHCSPLTHSLLTARHPLATTARHPARRVRSTIVDAHPEFRSQNTESRRISPPFADKCASLRVHAIEAISGTGDKARKSLPCNFWILDSGFWILCDSTTLNRTP